MKNTAVLVLSLSLASSTLVAQDATVRSLLSKDLAGIPGKELSMITVEYQPGGSDQAHRHHAQVLVYVLEGSIVMQVKGEAPIWATNVRARSACVGVGIFTSYSGSGASRVGRACASSLMILPNGRSAAPRRGSGIPLTGRSACSSIRPPALVAPRIVSQRNS